MSSSEFIDMKVNWDQAIRDVENRWVKRVKQANQQALEHIAAEIIDEAKTIVPVKTGALKNSLQVLTSRDGVVSIGSKLPYASYVERGTSKMKAEPYLWPSIKDKIAKYPETFSIMLYREG